MASKLNRALPVVDLDRAKNYLIAEINALRNVKGDVWIFVGATTMIEYLAALEKGKPAEQKDFIEFVRGYMPEYVQFKYKRKHRLSKTGVGGRLRILTRADLPEQMYYILRCGLVHGFSLVPGAKEIKNGGRQRSIELSNRDKAKTDGKQHLDSYEKRPHVEDAAYFVDEDFLDHLIEATNRLFAKKKNHKKISRMLKERPFIWDF